MALEEVCGPRLRDPFVFREIGLMSPVTHERRFIEDIVAIQLRRKHNMIIILVATIRRVSAQYLPINATRYQDLVPLVALVNALATDAAQPARTVSFWLQTVAALAASSTPFLVWILYLALSSL